MNPPNHHHQREGSSAPTSLTRGRTPSAVDHVNHANHAAPPHRHPHPQPPSSVPNPDTLPPHPPPSFHPPLHTYASHTPLVVLGQLALPAALESRPAILFAQHLVSPQAFRAQVTLHPMGTPLILEARHLFDQASCSAYQLRVPALDACLENAAAMELYLEWDALEQQPQQQQQEQDEENNDLDQGGGVRQGKLVRHARLWHLPIVPEQVAIECNVDATLCAHIALLSVLAAKVLRQVRGKECPLPHVTKEGALALLTSLEQLSQRLSVHCQFELTSKYLLNMAMRVKSGLEVAGGGQGGVDGGRMMMMDVPRTQQTCDEGMDESCGANDSSVRPVSKSAAARPSPSSSTLLRQRSTLRGLVDAEVADMLGTDLGLEPESTHIVPAVSAAPPVPHSLLSPNPPSPLSIVSIALHGAVDHVCATYRGAYYNTGFVKYMNETMRTAQLANYALVMAILFLAVHMFGFSLERFPMRVYTFFFFLVGLRVLRPRLYASFQTPLIMTQRLLLASFAGPFMMSPDVQRLYFPRGYNLVEGMADAVAIGAIWSLQTLPNAISIPVMMFEWITLLAPASKEQWEEGIVMRMIAGRFAGMVFTLFLTYRMELRAKRMVELAKKKEKEA